MCIVLFSRVASLEIYNFAHVGPENRLHIDPVRTDLRKNCSCNGCLHRHISLVQRIRGGQNVLQGDDKAKTSEDISLACASDDRTVLHPKPQHATKTCSLLTDMTINSSENENSGQSFSANTIQRKHDPTIPGETNMTAA